MRVWCLRYQDRSLGRVSSSANRAEGADCMDILVWATASILMLALVVRLFFWL